MNLIPDPLIKDDQALVVNIGDVHPDVDQLIASLQSTGSDDAKKDGPEIFEKMSGYHPDEPHWYLPLLGVDPLQHR